MLSRSIILSSTLLLVFSLVGCASSSLPKVAPGSDKPSIYQVTQNLKTRLAKDDRLQGSKIDFDYDGVTVILNGTVKDTEQFGWAATVAAGTPGVASVINRLQVKPPIVETQVPKTPAVPRKPAAKPRTLESQTPPTSAQTPPN